MFHGAVSLAAALSASGGWLLLSGVLGWSHPLADTLVGLACLLLGSFGGWQVLRAQRHLADTARDLSAGRLETRASTAWHGQSGELARRLNQLARALTQLHDRQAEGELQTHTRLRQEQERLQQTNRELRRALNESLDAARTQSELFSNLSHELRTPLTAVLGYADLLRKSGLSAAQEQQLATLDRSARGMLGMINDLLDWSRIEAGKLQLHEDRFDVLATVEDTTTLLAPLAYEKNLELVRICYHDVPRQITGDAQRLRQILTNLISNAIKFTPAGEVVVRVMREREEGGKTWLRFSVSDSGIGIAPEQQQALFRPFQQASRSTGGSGLGLAITRRLAGLMGGEIALDSEPGRGSTFSALLPFAELQQEGLLERTPDRRLREHSVWVLEAHATARLALSHWLEFWGLRVTSHDSAGTLGAALERATPNMRPAAVIVGASESEAAEPVFLERLRSWSARAPVLVMLSSVSLDAQARLRAAGAAACLPKCVGHEGLQAELLRLAGGTPHKRPLPGHRVLVADNNLPARRYIAALCAELGLQVFEAADGVQALEIWHAQQPEFVLLDARMPAPDGPACARSIRAAEGARRRCRIYAISAHLEPEERREFLDAGADGVLIKPFDGRQLARALRAGEPAPPSNSATSVLGSDPALLQLLLEELPEQYGELAQAVARADSGSVRAATHQLHGTASFYHLAALKESCATLEQQLVRREGGSAFGPARDRIQRDLDATLGEIRDRLAASRGTAGAALP
jgi:two-component system, NarL family, sensor histidine kinase BarA